jgi:hypothetical protein
LLIVVDFGVVSADLVDCRWLVLHGVVIVTTANYQSTDQHNQHSTIHQISNKQSAFGIP